ncbi:hypothetical protein E2562_035695 [Oryza meyeriana var. granulata]|uniref:Uncharacterized protein n=1 Tax=Oryza meyeriana var. granulata TaxID=110450 RepID=A0A6G1E724_9ORYZ|nr:hypothetical protein E2562_035695 [Oryza meyeriana var. granulata]
MPDASAVRLDPSLHKFATHQSTGGPNDNYYGLRATMDVEMAMRLLGATIWTALVLYEQTMLWFHQEWRTYQA